MIKELENLPISKFIEDGYKIVSAYTTGHNVDELRRNWRVNLKKNDEFLVLSKEGVEKEKPLLSNKVTDLRKFDERIYKYLEDVITKVNFSIKNIYMSLSGDEIIISLFSDILKVRKIVLDVDGNVKSDEKKNLAEW